MVSGPAVGMVTSICLFLGAMIALIVFIVQTAPVEQIRSVTTTTLVDTRSIFSSSNSTNQNQLVLSEANQDLWTNTAKRFDADFQLNLNITTFEQVVYTKFEELGGYRLNETGSIAGEFDGQYGLKPISWSNISFGEDNATREVVVVEPKTKITYKGADSKQEITTMNYDGLSIWFKLKNAPWYQKGWQIMSVVADKMNTQSFQTYYYGLYAYYDYFNNEADVDTNVLNIDGWTTNTQNKIYTDERYGMDSPQAMSYWVACSLSNRNGQTTDSPAYVELQEYFLKEQSVTITDANLNQICGTGSILMDEIDKIELRLMTDGKVTATPISAQTLSAVQWATSSLLGTYIDDALNTTESLTDPLGINNMYDLGMDWVETPEMPSNSTFTAVQAEALFDQTQGAAYSLCNPEVANAQGLNAIRGDPMFAGVTSPFGTTGMTYTQTYALGYWIWNTSNTMKYLTEGQIISKAISSSQELLAKVFPAEFATRNLGHQLNLSTGSISCNTIMNDATTNLTTINNVCTQYNFGNLEDLRFFVNGTWFGEEAYNNVQTATGMNDAEMTKFYDPTDNNSFGNELYDVLLAMANKYDCATQNTPQANCTTEELTPHQWGSSYFTYTDPVYTPGSDATFIPKAFSIYDWGGQPNVEGVIKPPELSAYIEKPYYVAWDRNMTPAQVAAYTATGYSYYGMNNAYNAARIWDIYVNQEQQGITPSRDSYWWSARKEFGFQNNDLARSCYALSWMVSEWVMMGLTNTYVVKDLITGYNSTVTERFNSLTPTNSMNKGFITVDPQTSPIMNTFNGPTANRTYTLFTGQGYYQNGTAFLDLESIGSIRQVDADQDGPEALLKQQTWTGLAWKTVYWINEAANYVPRFYSKYSPTTSNYNLKFPMQDAVNMGVSSYLRMFNVQSFLPIYMQHADTTNWCAQEMVGGCIQEIPQNSFQKTAYSDWEENKIQDTMNMPYNIKFANLVQQVDQNSGYTTKYDSYYEFSLKHGMHFFIGGSDQAPVIARVETAITTDQDVFLEEVYPKNGTDAWPTGSMDETYILSRKEGSPEDVIPICISAVAMGVALALVIVTCDCFMKERNAAKAAYQAGAGIKGSTDFTSGGNATTADETVDQAPLMTVN